MMTILEAMRTMGLLFMAFSSVAAASWKQVVIDQYRRKSRFEHPDKIQNPTKQQIQHWQRVSEARDLLVEAIDITLAQPFGEFAVHPGHKPSLQLAARLAQCPACCGESSLPGKNVGHLKEPLCPFAGRKFSKYKRDMQCFLFRRIADGRSVGEAFDDWNDEIAAKAAAEKERQAMKRELEASLEKDRKAARLLERQALAQRASAEARLAGEPAPSTPVRPISDATREQQSRSAEKALVAFRGECPVCLGGVLKQRIGPYGVFLGCSNFFNADDKCTYTRKVDTIKPSMPEPVAWSDPYVCEDESEYEYSDEDA